ncbi:MAG: leucine-rich repeat protein, partial [Clostridia bacterium]|nr:leucine-rich repeat protein [Clostridia bacterium]
MNKGCVFCTNCGSKSITFDNGKYICNSCQSIFEEERVNSKLFVDLTQANNERQSANFEKAKDIYKNIIKENPNEDLTDIYWGMFLCNQNVIFEEDGKKEMFPSFYKISNSPIQDDEYYKLALDSAKNDKDNKYDTFKNLAEKIESAKNMYLDISTTTKPFDIFICFKNSDKDGNHTPDRQLAMDIYNEFSGKYNIFFSEKTLKNIKSNYRNYEPNIYYGLYTAKVMLLICSNKEYIESQWLKNEWERFTQINKQGERGKCIIPIFTQHFNPDNLPNALWHSQGVFDDIKLISNLSTQLETIINPVDLEKLREQKIQEQMEELRKKQEEFARQSEEALNQKLRELSSSAKVQSVPSVGNVTTNSLLERIEIFLEDGNFDSAEEYADRVLDMEAKNSKAYLYKCLCDYGFKSTLELTKSSELIYENRNFQKALNYADEEYKKILEDYKNSCIYNHAEVLVKRKQYLEAISFFEKIKEFKDSEKRIEDCYKTLNDIYNDAQELEKNYDFQKAINKYEKIINFKDCKDRIDFCKKGIECEKHYQFALKNSTNIPKLVEVCDTLKKIDIPNYKDSDELLKSCGEILTQVYDQARNLETEYKFTNAIEKYDSIITYRDSRDRIKYCENGIKSEKKYVEALNLASKNKYFEAIDVLNNNFIKNYKDTEQKINEFNEKIEETYVRILKLRDEYEYAQAITLAVKILNYKDLKDVKKYCENGLKCEDNYQKGLDYKNKECIYEARNTLALIDIPNYKNTLDLIKECDEILEKNRKALLAKKRTKFLIKLSIVSSIILVALGALLIQCVSMCNNPFITKDNTVTGVNFVAKLFVKEITIPDDIVLVDEEAFKNCKNLQVVNFSGNLKSINNSAFENCEKLQVISSLQNVTYLGDKVFKNCKNLESVALSSELTVINDSLFYNCERLANITLSDKINTIYDNAFYNCDGFTEITMSNNVIYLGKSAFSECSNLEKITLSSELTVLESNVFYNCEKLKDFTIPEKVTTIKEKAFANCLAIESVYYHDNLETVSQTAFEGCVNISTISRRVASGLITVANTTKVLNLRGSATDFALKLEDGRTEDLTINLENVIIGGIKDTTTFDFSGFEGKIIIGLKSANSIVAGANSVAIYAKNLELKSLQESAKLNLEGGYGENGTTNDLNAKEGGTALKGGTIKIDPTLFLSLKGGDGGNGGSNTSASRWNAGKRGGDGGAGGFALDCEVLDIESTTNITLKQAQDGNGGLGGTGRYGSDG